MNHIFKGRPVGRIGATPADRFRMEEIEKRAKALEKATKIRKVAVQREELPLLKLLK